MRRREEDRKAGGRDGRFGIDRRPCVVGRAAYIAMGAIVTDRITIGEESVVAAGAVVVEDVPPNVQVVGVPARIVKRDVQGR